MKRAGNVGAVRVGAGEKAGIGLGGERECESKRMVAPGTAVVNEMRPLMLEPSV